MLQNIKLRKQEQQYTTYRLKTERKMGSFPLLTRADTYPWLGATSCNIGYVWLTELSFRFPVVWLDYFQENKHRNYKNVLANYFKVIFRKVITCILSTSAGWSVISESVISDSSWRNRDRKPLYLWKGAVLKLYEISHYRSGIICNKNTEESVVFYRLSLIALF